MDYNNKKQWGTQTQKRVAQFKRVPQTEKDEIMRQMITTLRSKELTETEEELVENAEVAVIDYETLKKKVYDCKTIEGLTDITRKYGVVEDSYLADYIRRRSVWLKAFAFKNGKTSRESVVKLLNRYKSSFREIDQNKVIAFINSENYGGK